MNIRTVARWSALATLTVALAFTPPAISAAPEIALPPCPAGGASTTAPTGPAGPGAPGACRAAGRMLESGTRIAGRGQAGFTPSGYHHLGANTGGEWAGVSGRLGVVDGAVRANTYDFVAARFMAKRNLGRGTIAWLEAGWAETGWATPGRQHVYTFNTNTKTWQFYDQYLVRPGDRLWLDLHADSGGVWSAWLWWNNRWNLLTAQRLPLGETAVAEQYVEIHVDNSRPTRVAVPAVTVDNVRLRPAGGGEARLWREDVPTLTGGDPRALQQRNGGFCLDWRTRYDTWTAGDCRDGEALPPPAPEPLPSGDAELVDPSPPAPARSSAPPTARTAVPPAVTAAPASPSASAAPTSPGPRLLGGLLGAQEWRSASPG